MKKDFVTAICPQKASHISRISSPLTLFSKIHLYTFLTHPWKMFKINFFRIIIIIYYNNLNIRTTGYRIQTTLKEIWDIFMRIMIL